MWTDRGHGDARPSEVAEHQQIRRCDTGDKLAVSLPEQDARHRSEWKGPSHISLAVQDYRRGCDFGTAIRFDLAA